MRAGRGWKANIGSEDSYRSSIWNGCVLDRSLFTQRPTARLRADNLRWGRASGQARRAQSRRALCSWRTSRQVLNFPALPCSHRVRAGAGSEGGFWRSATAGAWFERVEAVFSQDRGFTSVRQAKGTMVFVDYDDTRCATRCVLRVLGGSASEQRAEHAHRLHTLLRKCIRSGHGADSLSYSAVMEISSCGVRCWRAALSVSTAQLKASGRLSTFTLILTTPVLPPETGRCRASSNGQSLTEPTERPVSYDDTMLHAFR